MNRVAFKAITGLCLVLFAASACAPDPEHTETPPPAVTITLGEGGASGIAELGLDVPVAGRAFFIVSRDDEDEPRLGTGPTGNPLWGVDVRDFKAGDSVRVTRGASGLRGYPLASLDELPAGEYRVQAFLNVYTRFERADGHVIEAHLNSGAFQDPFRAPGNAYSDVQALTIPADGPFPGVELVLDRVIQPERPLAEGETLQQGNPEDTDWVKYVKIRSDVLSEFWGRDTYLGANVLLPPGYDENPDATYPVLYLQGHSSGLTPVPWSPEEWFLPGYEATHPAVGDQLDGFYDAWTAGELPKFVVITFRDANPYFDTSYSVDTENVGPYGTALTEELMPFLEREFRIVAEPWGRVLAGRSTGGWEAAAMMIFYPDLFAGAWPWAPDPIDFRKLMQINIYESRTAFWNEFEWMKTPYPGQRETDGLVNYFTKNEYDYEQAVGDKDRSAGQWAIWQALYSPVGEDGYPKPLWDPETGVIDRAVAQHWRENWDLSHIVARDWPELGEKLRGKLHFAVGRMDNYYLEQAVYLAEQRIRALEDPPADATFQYGINGRHSWIGHSPVDPDRQITYAEFIGVIGDYVRENAPDSADLSSWNY